MGKRKAKKRSNSTLKVTSYFKRFQVKFTRRREGEYRDSPGRDPIRSRGFFPTRRASIDGARSDAKGDRAREQREHRPRYLSPRTTSSSPAPWS